jgi:hypothetical protein
MGSAEFPNLAGNNRIEEYFYQGNSHYYLIMLDGYISRLFDYHENVVHMVLCCTIFVFIKVPCSAYIHAVTETSSFKQNQASCEK